MLADQYSFNSIVCTPWNIYIATIFGGILDDMPGFSMLSNLSVSVIGVDANVNAEFGFYKMIWKPFLTSRSLMSTQDTDNSNKSAFVTINPKRVGTELSQFD